MVHFHQAIGTAISELRRRFADELPDTVIVRDAIGALSVIVPDEALDADALISLRKSLHEALGAYSRGERAVLIRRSDLVDPEDILDSQDLLPIPGESHVSLLDRLQTNQEWLRRPIAALPDIQIAAAFSIKGGVGRSTAIAVLAWYLARRGKNVLVVDLDLEAPGIASLLLDEPSKLGLIDWLAESLVGQADANMLDDMICIAPISDVADGHVRVLPAFGVMTEDYVSKLGRAYLPVIAKTGTVQGFGQRIALLLRQIASAIQPPDLILLDARAGMHDIGAAAVTQLGADVLLFARDDLQTWAAYQRLFTHLRLSSAIAWGMPEDDLRWRLKMVAAQLDPTDAAFARYVSASYDAWSNLYDDEGQTLPSAQVAQVFQQSDEAAPHFPLRIAFDPRIRGVGMSSRAELPSWEFLEASYGPFLSGFWERIIQE